MCFVVIRKEDVENKKSELFIWIEKKSHLSLQRFFRKALHEKGV